MLNLWSKLWLTCLVNVLLLINHLYNTGTDYFGPFFFKQGRASVKRYGCIFTCLTNRAVHLEVAHSLTADSFINSFGQFICRRTKPHTVLSYNGTNLIGAEKELRQALKELITSTSKKNCVRKTFAGNSILQPSAILEVSGNV